MTRLPVECVSVRARVCVCVYLSECVYVVRLLCFSCFFLNESWCSLRLVCRVAGYAYPELAGVCPVCERRRQRACLPCESIRYG